jgi:hypothetical protein
MDLGIAHGTYISNTVGTINGINNGVIHGTANGVYNEINSYGLDPNAQAFILAARITDMMQKRAINNLVKSLKIAGIWSKCNAIYPFVGGNSSAHSLNLINTAQYQLTFVNGWVHANTGATPNGTNAYANTGLNGSTVLTQSNTHLSFYSRTNPAAAARIAMGSYNDLTAPNPILNMALKNAAGNLVTANANQSAGQLVSVANTDSRGFYVSNKTSASIGGLVIDKNGTQVASNSSAITTNSYANLNIFIGASSLSSATAFQYDLKECAFASIGLGLTATERSNYYTIVQAYQTILNRNV